MKHILVLIICILIILAIREFKKDKEVVPQLQPIPQIPNIPQEHQKPQEYTKPEFVEVPVYRQQNEQSVYGDVLSHSKGAPFSSNSRSTTVHETAHGVHSEIRNEHQLQLKKKVNGFYVLEGNGVVIEEPGIRKSHVNNYIPENLRSYRYSTYLAGQSAWDDTPLYLLDEWTAYVLGGKCNVEDVQQGRYKDQWTDGVSGCLDFSIYSIALCMAVAEKDPEYWKSNIQFKNYMKWWLKEAEKTFVAGYVMDQFKWDKQDKLLSELVESQSAAPMREFIKQHFDGVFLNVPLRVNYYEPYQQRNLICKPCEHFLRRR